MKSIEQWVELNTRDSENGIDAVLDERVGNRLAAVAVKCLSHAPVPSSSFNSTGPNPPPPPVSTRTVSPRWST